MIDAFGRTIDYLRISITDRCNLRCVYCMPEDGQEAMRHEDVLRYEEIERIVRQMAQMGIRHVRITGGEPMARSGCLDLVEMLHNIPGIEDICMTTNGLLLKGKMAQAKARGLSAVNISIDSVEPSVYRELTRMGKVEDALAAVDEALCAGLRVKVNCVPVRGVNEEGLCDVAALAKDRPISVRFIELMPVGCGAGLRPIPSDEAEAMMRACFGPLDEDLSFHGYGPARYLRPRGFQGSLGFISAVSHEFCDRCNRVRLTADGRLKLCLNHTAGLDLRSLVRSGIDDDALRQTIRQALKQKPRCHGFGDEVEDRETRTMNEIGG